MTTAMSFALSTWALFISLMQAVNHAETLYATCLLLASVYYAATSSPAPVIVMVPFTNMSV